MGLRQKSDIIKEMLQKYCLGGIRCGQFDLAKIDMLINWETIAKFMPRHEMLGLNYGKGRGNEKEAWIQEM